MEAAITKAEQIDTRYAATLLLPLMALSVGVISYGPWWWTIGLSVLFPVLLFKCESRLQSFLVALLYHMGATRSLATAAGQFYGDQIFFGVAIWGIGNAINGAIYAAVWHPRHSLRLLTIPLGMLLTCLPPFGLLGWANPLTAAGILFPGAGLMGFAYLVGVYGSLSTNSRGFLKGFALIALWCFFTSKTPKQNFVTGLSSSFHKTDDEGRGDYRRQIQLRERVGKTKGKILLLPEGVVSGGWTEAGKRLWAASEKRTVLIGAVLKIDRPKNVMINVKSGTIYSQRQPIPLSMWRPFDSTSFDSAWFENPILQVDGKKIAPLICYEGFLVWPIVHSYLAGAEQIVATGNYWWAGPKEIPVIHESIVKSWSRLFSIPYTMAVNL